MPATPPPEVTTAAATALLEAKQRMQDDLLAQLAAFVRNVLRVLRITGDGEAEAVDLIVTAVEQGREQAAELSRVYVDTVLSLDGSAPTVVPDVDRDALVRDWSELVDRYLAAESEALVAEVESFLADEIRSAGNSGVETPGARYRRVIHPELSKGGTCGLCVAAAHRLYWRADLKKIHDGCNCDVVPATDARDIGKEINDADLGATYDAASSRDGWTLKQVRFKDQGGELVPVKERKAKGARKPRPTKSASQK